MLTTGVRTPVGIKIYGANIHEIERVLPSVSGTRGAFAERTSGGFFARVRVCIVLAGAAEGRRRTRPRAAPVSSHGSWRTLIAAHALSLNLTLVTNNAKHFQRVAGLRTANWV